LRGVGEYDAGRGVESPRIVVTLATGIPRELCTRVNLGYADPASFQPETLNDGDTLVVPKAGERLYRLKPHGAQAG
jgi:hypothetical protein